MPPTLTDRIAALYAKEPGICHYLRYAEARDRVVLCSTLPPRTWPACAATVLEAARQFLGEQEAHLDRHRDDGWRATLGELGTGGCRGGGATAAEAVVALWEAILS